MINITYGYVEGGGTASILSTQPDQVKLTTEDNKVTMELQYDQGVPVLPGQEPCSVSGSFNGLQFVTEYGISSYRAINDNVLELNIT